MFHPTHYLRFSFFRALSLFSQNSDPGSHSRLSSLPPHHGICTFLCGFVVRRGSAMLPFLVVQEHKRGVWYYCYQHCTSQEQWRYTAVGHIAYSRGEPFWPWSGGFAYCAVSMTTAVVTLRGYCSRELWQRSLWHGLGCMHILRLDADERILARVRAVTFDELVNFTGGWIGSLHPSRNNVKNHKI